MAWIVDRSRSIDHARDGQSVTGERSRQEEHAPHESGDTKQSSQIYTLLWERARTRQSGQIVYIFHICKLACLYFLGAHSHISQARALLSDKQELPPCTHFRQAQDPSSLASFHFARVRAVSKQWRARWARAHTAFCRWWRWWVCTCWASSPQAASSSCEYKL